MKLTLGEIAVLVGGTVEGNEHTEITEIHSLSEARAGSISFLANPKYEAAIYSTNASAVIVNTDFAPKKELNIQLIRSDDPYIAFTLLLDEYQRITGLSKAGIEKPVHIGEQSSLGNDAYVGAFAYIGDRVNIGNSVKIYPHAYIGDDVNIGDHTIIYPGVKVYAKTRIGRYCTIHAGAVLGAAGFGYAPQQDGSYKSIPQVGNVILEDHVDIGANTTIDCGAVEATIIHKGVKIDNLVQIAHNVEIGEHTVIAAQSGISGSAKIGSNVIMGGQVGVQGHISIANQTTVGAKSGVTKTVRKKGQTISGKFAFNNLDYLKSYAIFKKLPEQMKRIEAIEQKLLNVSGNRSV